MSEHVSAELTRSRAAPRRSVRSRRLTDNWRWRQWRARSDRPALSALVVLVGSLIFVALRLVIAAKGVPSAFVVAGRHFVNPALAPRGLVVFHGTGYDGQFYYRLALDPFNLSREAFGITMDTVFRFQRMAYPFLAWLLSVGNHRFVPEALILINVASLTALGWLGGLIAKGVHRHSLHGILLAGFSGFVFSLARDTPEPMAAACMIGGLLARRRDRPVLAGILFAIGALTRETVLLAVAALVIARVARLIWMPPVPRTGQLGGFLNRASLASRRATGATRPRAAELLRPRRDDLAWAIPIAAFVAWQAVIWHVTGKIAFLVDRHDNMTRPLSAMFHAVGTNLRDLGPSQPDRDVWIIELVALGIIVGYALGVTVSNMWRFGHTVRILRRVTVEQVALILSVIMLLFLSSGIWNGLVDLRSMDDPFVLGVTVLLAGRWRVRVPAIAVVCVLPFVVAHRILAI